MSPETVRQIQPQGPGGGLSANRMVALFVRPPSSAPYPPRPFYPLVTGRPPARPPQMPTLPEILDNPGVLRAAPQGPTECVKEDLFFMAALLPDGDAPEDPIWKHVTLEMIKGHDRKEKSTVPMHALLAAKAASMSAFAVRCRPFAPPTPHPTPPTPHAHPPAVRHHFRRIIHGL